jgi:small subunit ribosomal protein S6
VDLIIERPIRKYEAVVILHPDVSDADAKALFKRNAETIAKFSGSVNHVDTWGKRRLANPIEKLKLGNFFHTTFEAKGDCVAELERLMKIDERVLRAIHVKLETKKTLGEYVTEFHNLLAESHKREQEKEAKMQARRLAMGSGGGRGPGGPGGGRRFRSDDEEDTED